MNYLNDKKYWKKWFPADFISENLPGQYRGWFNALMWASVTITGRAPFKSILGYELVKDEKGEEMHKSKGNAIWFNDAVEKMGGDPMRLLYCLHDPSQELRFGFNVIKEPQNNINILFNISKLIENKSKTNILKVEDKWILSKLNSLVKNITEEIEEMCYNTATKLLQDFWLNDLSRGYIQFVRDRIANGEKSSLYILREVYTILIKLCSPITPFITEAIWQELRNKKIVKEESVHLCSWPKADGKKIDKKLEEKFENALRVIEMGLAERDKEGIGLKWPLQSANITTNSSLNKELIDIIKSQLNVKIINLNKGKEKISLNTKITPELEAEGYARELSRQIQAFRKKLGLKKENKVETYIITDDKFKKILESHKNFLRERTNSKKLEFVITGKERFKNIISFTIKDKKGDIAVVY